MIAFGFVGRGVVVGGWITWELESKKVALGGEKGVRSGLGLRRYLFSTGGDSIYGVSIQACLPRRSYHTVIFIQRLHVPHSSGISYIPV